MTTKDSGREKRHLLESRLNNRRIHRDTECDRRDGRSFRGPWLAGLLLIALLTRVFVVFLLDSPDTGPVTYEHGRIAENLLSGRGFSITYLGGEGPTSQQAPFYPFFLAGIYGLFGVGTHTSHLAAQLIQCVVGTALVAAVFFLSRNLFPGRPRIAWIAAEISAFFPTHLYMVTHLQVVVWVAAVFTTLMWVVTSTRLHDTWRGAVMAGLLSGGLLLIEPIFALVLPVCAAAFWLGTPPDTRGRFRAGSLVKVGAMAGVAACVIAPWVVRNYAVHDRFVFVKASFGYAFWQGNNPASCGTDKIPKSTVEAIRTDHDGSPADMNRAMWQARHETLYIDQFVLTKADFDYMATLSEPERSDYLGTRVWRFIKRHPYEYYKRCAQRLRFFLFIDETNPKAANWIYRLTTLAWLVCAVLGLWIGRTEWRCLWPTTLAFLVIMAFHALTITSVRFRIPLEPVSFLWVACFVGSVWTRIGHKPHHVAIGAPEGTASDSSPARSAA